MAKDDRVSGKKYKPKYSVRRRSRSASVGATRAVIKAWAEKYEQRDRRNPRDEDWQEIAAALNSCSEGRWTVESCKNRIRKVIARYEREKAAGLSSWIFFEWLDKLLGAASDELLGASSDAGVVWDLWELEDAVTETAGPVAELAWKLRGFEAQMKGLTGVGSDELVQALDRLEQAWSGFAASVADAAAAEDGSSETEEDLGADCWPRGQDDPDGAAGRQTEQLLNRIGLFAPGTPFETEDLGADCSPGGQDDPDGAAGRQTEQLLNRIGLFAPGTPFREHSTEQDQFLRK